MSAAEAPGGRIVEADAHAVLSLSSADFDGAVPYQCDEHGRPMAYFGAPARLGHEWDAIRQRPSAGAAAWAAQCLRRAHLIDGRWQVWIGDRWSDEVPEAQQWRGVAMPADDLWWALVPVEAGKVVTKVWRHDGHAWSLDKMPPSCWYVPALAAIPNTVSGWVDAFRRWPSDRLLVRGVISRGGHVGGLMRRMSQVKPEDGAWLAPHPVGRRVVIFDFDGIPADVLLPSWPGATRWPERGECDALIRQVLRCVLPGSMDGAACAYRWSASTGVPSASRGLCGWSRPGAHVAIILDRPVADESLRAWVKLLAARWSQFVTTYRIDLALARRGQKSAAKMVDPAVALSVQPLYLAPPRWVGADDPWCGRERVGRLDGAEVVAAPGELVDGSELRRRAIEEAERVERQRLERERQRLEREQQERSHHRASTVSGQVGKRFTPGPADMPIPERPATMSSFERCRRYLESIPGRHDGEGRGEERYRVACLAVRDFQLSASDAEAVVAEWDRKCTPPAGDKAVAESVRNAGRYGRGQQVERFKRSEVRDG